MAGHRWIVVEHDNGSLEGAAHCAPEPFSDHVWNLYFIAARPDRHRRGTGSLLLVHVEQALRAEGEGVARVLIVEMSSHTAYKAARSFHGRWGVRSRGRNP